MCGESVVFLVMNARRKLFAKYSATMRAVAIIILNVVS
jgi:hypothetical protein